MSHAHEQPLRGSKALVVGIDHDRSIAHGCARVLRRHGAELAITYLNEQMRSEVEPIARTLEAPLFLPLDVQVEGQLDSVFEAIEMTWGKLDVAVHAIDFAPSLITHKGLLDCSQEEFQRAIDVCCHSFIRMARLSVPLMAEGGSLIAMIFEHSPVPLTEQYLMGPVHAALQAAVRLLAVELGPLGIRVHAIRPGPVATRDPCGLIEIDSFLEQSRARSPLGSLVEIDDVGEAVAFLASHRARRMTGTTLSVDAGLQLTCAIG